MIFDCEYRHEFMTDENKLYKHVAFFLKHKIAFKNDRTKARNKKKVSIYFYRVTA